MFKKLSLFIFILLFISCNSNEHIIQFNSNIVINKNGSMNVQETITVLSLQERIRHGIFRDFPTIYHDQYNNKYIVEFEITKILRDGKTEPYHIEMMNNGKRIYIGDKNYYLPSGIYTYVIEYTTNRQLGFFKNYDELFWNVTGNGWIFPIEKANAQIILPDDIPINKVQLDGYTGFFGSIEKNFRTFINDRKIYFETSKPLYPHEGLSIVAIWPKGYITEPTFSTKIKNFLNDNLTILLLIIFFIILLIYYLVVWTKVTLQKPNKKTIIPLFETPNNLSPGAVRYIYKMSYDDKTFASEITNMAIKGYLKISFQENKYKLIKGNQPSKDEYSVYEYIWQKFFQDNDEIYLHNSLKIPPCYEKSKLDLHLKYKEHYFTFNSKYIVLGSLISFFPFGLIMLLQSFNVIYFNFSPLSFLLLILIILTNFIFYSLLKTYKKDGQEIYEKILGFKMFLSATEKERMNFLNAPDRTPEEFETFLPYAIALDVEEKWSKQFVSIFKQSASQGHPYVPIWYIGSGFYPTNIGAFSSTISNSFSRIISSSATPPGKISGFGGGGSSGGGGGGGGGGGW